MHSHIRSQTTDTHATSKPPHLIRVSLCETLLQGVNVIRVSLCFSSDDSVGVSDPVIRVSLCPSPDQGVGVSDPVAGHPPITAQALY